MEHLTRSFCVFAIAVLSAGATQVSMEDSAKILKTFSGSLTEITCASPHPCFHINDVYGPFEYNILPELFGIEAELAQDLTSVTLRIDGTSQVNNVSVECSNIINAISGQSESLFNLTIQLQETIPAPTDLNYNEDSGVLSWRSPQPDVNHVNASINLQITHYTVYITNPLTQTTTNFTLSTTEFETADIDMPCDASVQVCAVNSAGKGQASSAIIVNTCSSNSPSKTPKDSTLTTMAKSGQGQQEMGSSLSGGEIAAVAVTLSFVVLLLVSLSLIVAYCVVRGKHQFKRRSEKQPRETRPPVHGEYFTTSSPSIRSGQQDSTSLGMHSMTLYNLPDVVESDGAKCSNEYVNQPWQYTSTKRGLIYAELAPTTPNIISQPSCVENTTYAVIDHTSVQTDV